MEDDGCSETQSDGALNLSPPAAAMVACAEAGFIAGSCDACAVSAGFFEHPARHTTRTAAGKMHLKEPPFIVHPLIYTPGIRRLRVSAIRSGLFSVTPASLNTLTDGEAGFADKMLRQGLDLSKINGTLALNPPLC
jgi:hypothetical protein